MKSFELVLVEIEKYLTLQEEVAEEQYQYHDFLRHQALVHRLCDVRRKDLHKNLDEINLTQVLKIIMNLL